MYELPLAAGDVVGNKFFCVIKTPAPINLHQGKGRIQAALVYNTAWRYASIKYQPQTKNEVLVKPCDCREHFGLG